ncbi:MAG: hypothetical protein OXH92_18450 [Bryobacterales bacterium]|nr:hypothetical protein [Gammaproteobacteria bacterium]MDE0435985.1 hypothetical protein [Bryobacterales bacterium]
MLTATELYPLTTALTIVLWVEVVIYLGTGLYEVFDDYYYKPPKWVFASMRINTYIWFRDKKGHKMHASLAMVLGFIALNGVLEGAVFRFEIELIFISLALLNLSIWCMAPPRKRLALKMLPVAPEFHLQYISFIFFADLIRLEVLGLCVLFNLWGMFVFFRRTLNLAEAPQTYEELRADMVEADAGADLALWDKVAGYRDRERSSVA